MPIYRGTNKLILPGFQKVFQGTQLVYSHNVPENIVHEYKLDKHITSTTIVFVSITGTIEIEWGDSTANFFYPVATTPLTVTHNYNDGQTMDHVVVINGTITY